MPDVSSSVIRHVDYDRDSRRLFLTFTSGRVYRYDDLPASVFEALLNAPSQGEFFNAEIKYRYRTWRLTVRSRPAPRSAA